MSAHINAEILLPREDWRTIRTVVDAYCGPDDIEFSVFDAEGLTGRLDGRNALEPDAALRPGTSITVKPVADPLIYLCIGASGDGTLSACAAIEDEDPMGLGSLPAAMRLLRDAIETFDPILGVVTNEFTDLDPDAGLNQFLAAVGASGEDVLGHEWWAWGRWWSASDRSEWAAEVRSRTS